MLDRRYHELSNDQCVVLDGHPSVPNVDGASHDASQHAHPNVGDVQYAPNDDELNDGRNDDGVDVGNVQLHS